MKKNEEKKIVVRPPVIAIMGHIDHGKSTLLDYIRKTNITEKEAGGITQHISAYEVLHQTKDGKKNTITFLDTPGHEAFGGIRTRGARVADIAVLVVSAEDGVKKQTLDALKSIQEGEIPYIVAINKIDKPGADIEKTKKSLVENGIYIEGFGGQVPFVPISAKTGEGIPELLDMMLLVAEIEELKADTEKNAEGIVIDSHLDMKKGISGTIIIKDGTLKKGMFIVSGKSLSPVRIMENFLGKNIDEATVSSPVKIIGWNNMPQVGLPFIVVASKKEAEEVTLNYKKPETVVEKKDSANTAEEDTRLVIPIIIKADVAGSLEALEHEIQKIPNDKISIKIVQSGIGNISENDIKVASGVEGVVILGFHVKMDSNTESLRERMEIEVKTFNVIYKLVEWLKEFALTKTPKTMSEEATGKAKILKIFSKTKDKQIVGGKVESGSIKVGGEVKILRRDEEIGRGKIRELQQQKEKASEVKEGYEFGTQIQCTVEIAPGDRIECFEIVEK